MIIATRAFEYHYKILEYCNENVFIYFMIWKSLLEKVGVNAYKVASTDNQNYILLDYLKKKINQSLSQLQCVTKRK